MAKQIIGLVGQQGSGKGTVAKLLGERYGAKMFRFSSILRDILDRLHIEETRENMVQLSEVVRQGFGQDVLAMAMEQDAVAAQDDLVVVDGIRRPGDLVRLEPLPNFTLVAIDVPADIRYNRVKNRGENVGEKEMTREEFEAEEKLPTEITIPSVMAKATSKIQNTGTYDELVAKIDELMLGLGVTKTQ